MFADPLKMWILSVLYLRGVSSARRTCRASSTFPSSRYSRYFCCSSRNFILCAGNIRKSSRCHPGTLKTTGSTHPVHMVLSLAPPSLSSPPQVQKGRKDFRFMSVNVILKFSFSPLCPLNTEQKTPSLLEEDGSFTSSNN